MTSLVWQMASGRMAMDEVDRRSRSYLRLLIYSQVVWVIAVGLLVRSVIRLPESWRSSVSPDVEILLEFITIVAPLFLFPGLFTFLLYRAELPPRRTITLGLVQGALTVAAFAALLPAIQ